MSFDRRKFIIGSIAGLAAKGILADSCKFLLTPQQPEGPFYPKTSPLDTDADLTMVKGQQAKGEVVVVKGIIQDQFCRPVENAVVEVWQACHTGRYNHPSDTSTAKIDPHFQYYALMKTNSKGEYSYKTIIPGAYKASRNWIRPPHIHYKVSLRGYEELITQLYFKGNELNQRDSILNELNKEEKNKVIVEFKKDESGFLTGKFIVNIKKL
jgi:protocatechuate 3,4-dioxygenase beta subunit